MDINYPLIGSSIEVLNRSGDAKKYNFIQGVGKGGFGTVYMGRNCEIKRELVAIKVIDLTTSDDVFNRTKGEISIQEKLNNPHILKLHSSRKIDDTFYLILEFCENGNLKNYLERQPGGKLPESKARQFLDQIVQGLKYLHKLNILHGDISLNNLLLTTDFKIKIADFGLAFQLRDPNDLRTSVCGQRKYMAPEKAKKRLYGLPSDIWSVGCVFCHMITGESPFSSKMTSKGISSAALDLLSRMLLNDPEQRIKLSEIHKHSFFINYDKYKSDHQPVSAMDSGIETNGSSSSPSLSNNIPFYSRAKSPQTNLVRCSPRLNSPRENTISSSEKSLQFLNLGDENKDFKKRFYVENDIKCRERLGNFANVTSNPSSRPNTLRLNDNGYFNKHHGSNFDVSRQKRQDVEMWRSQSCTRNDNQRPMNSESRNYSYGSAGHTNFSHPKLNPSPSSELLSSRPGSRQTNSKIEERPMLPLCTNRLPPQDYSTTKGSKKSVKILDTGHVLVEIAKKTDAKVFDCCNISADGNTIIVYERVREERFKKIEFSFETLPPKHFSKYNYAIRFCSLVRSQTVKIRYRHQWGKWQLMENGDFKAVGLPNTKEIILPKGGEISIIYAEGRKEDESHDYLLDKFKKYYDECLKLEEFITKLNPGMFPLTCTTKKVNSKNVLSNKENVNLRR